MTNTVTAKRSPGRPKADPEQAESESLHRIAELAHHVLVSLRKDRGNYASERELRMLLTDHQVSFSNDDIAPALDLLEAAGKLVRPPVGPNTARPGWLPLFAPEPVESPTEADPGIALIDAVIRVLGSGRCESVDVLQERLADAGVDVTREDLDTAVQRLLDSGRLMRPRPRPTVENPDPPRQLIMSNLPRGFSQSGDLFDKIDALAADVIGTIKRRGDRFDDDAQLEGWLDEDQIAWTPEDLRAAIEQLEVAGLLSRPHRMREFARDPLPGFLDTPSWARSW